MLRVIIIDIIAITVTRFYFKCTAEMFQDIKKEIKRRRRKVIRTC